MLAPPSIMWSVTEGEWGEKAHESLVESPIRCVTLVQCPKYVYSCNFLEMLVGIWHVFGSVCGLVVRWIFKNSENNTIEIHKNSLRGPRPQNARHMHSIVAHEPTMVYNLQQLMGVIINGHPWERLQTFVLYSTHQTHLEIWPQTRKHFHNSLWTRNCEARWGASLEQASSRAWRRGCRAWVRPHQSSTSEVMTCGREATHIALCC